MRSVAQAEDQDLHDHGVRIQVQVRHLSEELDDEFVWPGGGRPRRRAGLRRLGRVTRPGQPLAGAGTAGRRRIPSWTIEVSDVMTIPAMSKKTIGSTVA